LQLRSEDNPQARRHVGYSGYSGAVRGTHGQSGAPMGVPLCTQGGTQGYPGGAPTRGYPPGGAHLLHSTTDTRCSGPCSSSRAADSSSATTCAGRRTIREYSRPCAPYCATRECPPQRLGRAGHGAMLQRCGVADGGVAKSAAIVAAALHRAARRRSWARRTPRRSGGTRSCTGTHSRGTLSYMLLHGYSRGTLRCTLLHGYSRGTLRYSQLHAPARVLTGYSQVHAPARVLTGYSRGTLRYLRVLGLCFGILSFAAAGRGRASEGPPPLRTVIKW
jgi:hypothetical protein